MTERNEILTLQLCLSAILPIAERHAQGIEAEACELVREATGRPPAMRPPRKPFKPQIVGGNA